MARPPTFGLLAAAFGIASQVMSVERETRETVEVRVERPGEMLEVEVESGEVVAV